MMKRCSLFQLAVGVVLFLMFTGHLTAQDATVKTVTASGISGISAGGTATARDQALEDALRKAVEQAVGAMIASETMVANYQVLSDHIYSRTHGYVTNYEVVSEKAEGGLYEVTIQAQVADGMIKNDLAALGLLMARKNMPRVMLMVAEQNVGQEQLVYWWSVFAGHSDVVARQADLTVTENTLMQILGEKGFVLIDSSVPKKQTKISNAYRVASLSDAAIRDIGQMFDAEIVVFGKSLAKLSGSVMGTTMKSVQADVSLRVVNTDTGQVIASATEHGAAVHPNAVTAGNDALRQTTEKLAGSLLDQIMARWGQDISGKGIVRIDITAVPSYKHLVTFKQALQERVRGVSGIYQREFDENRAALDVETSGSAQSLADQMIRLESEGVAFKIQNISQNRIQMQLQ